MATRNLGRSLEDMGFELPYNIQAEQSVLGAIILDPVGADFSGLEREMFYVHQNQAVFSEIYTLASNSEPIDVVILVERLKKDPAFSKEGEAKAYIAQLVNTVPAISNLPHYINIVQENYLKRRLMQQAHEILEQAGDDIEAKIMLESAEQKLYDIRGGKDSTSMQHLKYAILDIMSHLQRLSGPDREANLGIPTGFRYLDKKLTGMGRGDLIILAARPGMGKTSFALNIAMNVAKTGAPVAIFSLEMTKDQLAGRILSSEALVDSYIFRSGIDKESDWEDLTRVSELLGPMPVYLDDTSNITIPEMKTKIRSINREALANGKKPVGLIVIDYLQLMSTGRRSENRVQEISEITRNLKIMAKDLGVPIIALSQLSRSAEKNRADHKPMLSDLRDSGSIEQDADVVMFLYREAYYDDAPDADTTTAQCIVAKNRHGETATVDMFWDGVHTRFYEAEYRPGGY